MSFASNVSTFSPFSLESLIIRHLDKMDAIDFTVNNILASGDSKIIVPHGETVEVLCQPNGFKIGEDHKVTVLRGSDPLDSVAVFNEEAEVTCTAELDGEKVTKTVSVIPIGECFCDHRFSITSYLRYWRRDC